SFPFCNRLTCPVSKLAGVAEGLGIAEALALFCWARGWPVTVNSVQSENTATTCRTNLAGVGVMATPDMSTEISLPWSEDDGHEGRYAQQASTNGSHLAAARRYFRIHLGGVKRHSLRIVYRS